MKIVCVGPGAMGCLFAASLSRAGHEVSILDYKQERAEEINKNGINVESPEGNFSQKVTVNTDPQLEGVDLVLICVKAGKTAEVARELAGAIEDHTLVLSLQNGVGNVETLGSILGEYRVLGGVTSEGATLLGPGHIRHAGKGQTFIGPLKENPKSVPDIISAFNEAGFDTKFSQNVHSLIWGKLIINVGINALTAITRLRNGVLPQLEETRILMEQAVVEASQVARANGIELPYDDPLSRVFDVCNATADNVASMLQDVLNRRPTEVSFINGAIVREGKRLGIPTPVNDTLTQLIRAMEKSYEMQLA